MRWRRGGAGIAGIGVLVALGACNPGPIINAEPPTTFAVAPSITLKCGDGVADPSPAPAQILLTDHVGSALRAENPSLPKAVEVGIPAPSKEWSFRKAPLFLAADSGGVTLGVPNDGQQYLLWSRADAWTGEGASDEDRGAWVTTQVNASGCDGMTTSFYGGLLVLDPTRCFSLKITEDGQPKDEVPIRGDGRACPESSTW